MEEIEAPDPNEEYLLYQTLLGTWPVDRQGGAEKQVDHEYVQRIQQYMHKALNEAKINTSWVQPNEEHLAATGDFVSRILEPSAKNKFLAAFYPVADEIARLGAINSLSQVLLKFTSPGVPDIYQGNDLWDFSLVDPDNRRPVDYARRREILATLDQATPEALLHGWPDGRIKMFLTRTILRFRKEQADLFRHGSYEPANATGPLADCCVSFTRQLNGKWVLVVAPRLSSRVGFPPVGPKWQDTAVELPAPISGGKAREIFTNRAIRFEGRYVRVADILATLPFAVLTNL